MSLPEPHHIIAIGASAGGMEEINAFFDHTPMDGVSYIIIQHLSADFKSRMVELLSKHSKLIVEEAEEGMEVKGNQVYLIPNNKFMTIQKNRLHLSEKNKHSRPHLTINNFFASLAADYGRKAIAVILSGLGSDGTEGVKAVKAAGGMVIARSPETTEFDSMPSKAIATGMVDLVLEPARMPEAIEDYIKQELDETADGAEDEKVLTKILAVIKENLPLDFSGYKRTTLFRRAKRRADLHNLNSLEKYLDVLKKEPEEMKALAQEFLISVTSFFRDKEAFSIIKSRIIPTILKSLKPGEELRIWVAGCATGEEAFSLAILVAEQLKGEFKNTVAKIFATDIDNPALAHARRGIYSKDIEKDVSREWLEKYFTQIGEDYKVRPEIRKMVIFSNHDLARNPPYCNMHLICCRNLLIYLTPVLQTKIFSMFLFGLKPDGYLFLGTSENPAPILQKLEVIDKKWRIYKSLETKRTVNFNTFSTADLLTVSNYPSRISKELTIPKQDSIFIERIFEKLIDQLDYLILCVNENNEVVKSFGETSKYLLPKVFETNLINLLPKPLVVAYSTLVRKVLNTNEQAISTGIKIKTGKSFLFVTLSVSHLVLNGELTLLMVTFSEDNVEKSGLQKEEFNEKLFFDQYTADLENKVKDLEYQLSSFHERLDATNENMQSFNEELISANEEMQSTNEEMQSVNEELDTINSEFQIKNKELLEMNDDLNNYFRSNINGQIFINSDLELIRFSPGAVKQINLRETDIGRPLSNISTNIKMETIIKDIEGVILTGTVVTKEIETTDDRWYQIMTMPYEKGNGHRDGAIVTFNDISELKKTQFELDKKNKSLHTINADLDHFVFAASHDLLAPLGNIEGSIAVINEMEDGDPGLKQYLQIINGSIVKFRSLIKDIATIAKLESDSIAMEEVDLAELLDNVEWSLEKEMTTSKATIVKNLKIKKVYFSKKNLRSILYNLVSNGIKFRGEEAPELYIETAKKDDQIVLTVKDNGIGIHKKNLEQIFNLYGRFHQDVEGQGIGLFLAKKIIHAAGGDIVVESTLGKGSTFTIFFKTLTM